MPASTTLPPAIAALTLSGDYATSRPGYFLLTTLREKLVEELRILNDKDELLSAQHQDIETELDAAATSCSRCWSLGFTPKFLSVLPREVRDMIYISLLGTPKIVHVVHRDDSIFGSRPPSPVRLCTGPFATWDDEFVHFGHFGKAKFFGKVFVEELVQAFYENTTFEIPASPILRRFLTNDSTSLGCYPKDHIRRLKLNLALTYRLEDQLRTTRRN
ncbi:hypothetical protein BCR34DRAFT_614872 [Clohesyomyces aquaticus]|uniref:Uncharacterized protein n=1 Tax=Clohesyomyces aquaticus TaxID=1231657 RepID=A0A1Y1ZL13_9PLEO|nr:hypothetical protein BCR34DRAFT_614872 [Clohesyomyces aquaticus]